MIHGDGGHAKVLRDIAITPHDAWVVAVGDNYERRKEAQRLQREGCKFGVAIHAGAIVSPKAKIGEGSMIMAGAVIQADAVIGKHCIVNTCASVDHDSVLSDYVHIAPGAHLCGGVQVGEGAFIGTGVCVAPGYHIPAWTLVKARRFAPDDFVGMISP